MGTSGLANGPFEEFADGRAAGWVTVFTGADEGVRFAQDLRQPFEGTSALLIDSVGARGGDGNVFANCMQAIRADGWRGKRVRFRAAVRTAELADDAKAQLWMRVDRQPAEGASRPAPGFFDNMDDRPIRGRDWQTYEIVGNVADDASHINVGLFVVGSGQAWIDAASLEEVPVEVPTTGGRGIAGELDFETQPFWTWWLVLPAVGIGLMLLGQFHPGWLGTFGFRFSFCYWVLYFFPAPLDSVMPWLGSPMEARYQQSAVDPVVRWTAAHLLGIRRELTPPGGSGDSTFSHVQLLLTFMLALVLAAAWSLVQRRACTHPHLRDLLRSYVRYALAFTMLGYGLAKVVTEGGQFRPPGVDQLEKAWGDSSPMNVLWTFMGYSWPYTFFAGMGEVVGGFLLLWRRTTVLGTLVTFGVMLNVVMLNFCYDVPVKLYSSHLCLSALFVLMPDAGRLANLLVWNRPAAAADLRPPWAPGGWRWLHRAGKTWLIGFGFGLPVVTTVAAEIHRAFAPHARPAIAGEFRVTEFASDSAVPGGDAVPHGETARKWRSFFLESVPAGTFQPGVNAYCIIRTVDHDRINALAVLAGDGAQVALRSMDGQTQGDLRIERLGPDEFHLQGTAFGQAIRVRIRRSSLDQYLLMRRGFRWISEQPFNR